MKFFAILSLLSVTALAGNTWYDSAKDLTCTGDLTSGDISCESGHVGEAPEVTGEELQSRAVDVLSKRASCNVQVGPVDGCFLHCYAENYCNAYCDSKNTCICRCQDNGAFCTDTTCN